MAKKPNAMRGIPTMPKRINISIIYSLYLVINKIPTARKTIATPAPNKKV
jgi:hypothetical protein